MQNNTMKEIEKITESLIPVRRHIHANPEIGLACQKTRDYVKDILEKMGYKTELIGVSGLTTTVGNGKEPVFLLRADMDALPIDEDTDLEFASTNPNHMHACGHDIHTTMLLGAAQYLKNHEAEINGTVKFMFQPGEETAEGATDMINNGILENPKPEAGMMIHVAPGVPFDVGTIIIPKAGPAMASNDLFDIIIKGKGGHGSTPYLCVDPLVPGSTIMQAIQNIITKELPPNALTALTIGKVEGLDSYNIIPEIITLGGTLRTYSEERRKFIKERITEISDNISKAFRCTSEVDYLFEVPTLLNAKEVAEVAYDSLKPFLEPDHLMDGLPIDIPLMGSEDFAFVTHEIPSTAILIVASDARAGGIYPLHHPKLVFDEKAIESGILAYSQIALGWIKNNQKK